MRMIKGMLTVAAAACFAFGTASADNLADINVASDAAKMAPAGGGDAESLTSLKKKGAVKIGGDIEIDILALNRDECDDDSDCFDKTEFKTSDADLDIRVDMTTDAFLFIKLDLDDFERGDINCEDLLEEVNMTWKNVKGSDFTFIIGKDEMPFGMDTDYLVTDPYTHNSGTGSYLANSYDNEGVGNTHSTVSESAYSNSVLANRFVHPGEIDNVFALQAQYAFKDLAKLEFAVFQNNEGALAEDSMHEDNSTDSLLLRSYATRLWVTPLEGLKMQLSFANQHFDGSEDADWAGVRGGEDDMPALSFGIDYKMSNVPLEFYGEYIHGWNQRHMDEVDTDTIQVGIVWGVTEKIDLITDFEWLGTDDETMLTNVDEDLYRWSIGGAYKTDYGVKFMLEYLHEWYNSDNGWDDADADVIAFRTAYSF